MPSDVDISSFVEKFESFYSDALREKINKLLTDYPAQKSLLVDFEDLEKYDRELADILVRQPDTLINAAELALVQSQEVVFKNAHPDVAFEPHVRFFNLPDSGLLIQDISSRNIRELLSVKGVITKRGPILHKVKVAVYKCQMCDATTKVPMTKNAQVPQVCGECKRRALKLEEEDSYFVDVQKAEAQELLERLTGGAPAATITLWMEDDLVNKITPGDTIEITGVMRLIPPAKPRTGTSESSQIYTRYIDVVYAKKTQKDFEEIETTKEDEARIRELAADPKIYEKMYESVAQGIYGHSEVKEALTLQLFGGTKDKFIPGGAPIRNDIHILLIGDPGSAKTRFLQYVKDLAPKGIFVSGKSVTGVGLTASAEKDDLGDGGWTLKAGALVIASGGIASVDEFDKIDEGERAAMHEVMESQSYHPSTKLMLADGREVNMGDFVEGLLSQNRGRVKTGKDCLVLDSGLEGIKVLTSDFEKIYPVQISQASKHKAPDHFIKVTLQNGRILLVTPEHPFWIPGASGISTTAASDLKSGDYTLAPSQFPVIFQGVVLSEIKIINCRINSVETVKNDGVEWVYDVGAGPTKAFISECALLHNTVSVAKAGIVAQFKAKTSILAAANPKFGRFDPNQLPGKQFDIPPTILSRFDLIFPIIDVMDETKDAALADYMLKTHRAGSESADKAKVDPNIIPKSLLRKYISYARQNFRPRLTDGAMKKIKDFYVELRKMGKAEGAVPITPRQIEGLVRLSEASAKLRLSDTVDESDAERAIRLTQYVLEKVSRDRETGKLDIDIIATGKPKSQVDKINAIMAIAARIQAQLGTIEVVRLVGQATDEGIADEMTVRRIVDDLIYKGELYKIKPGFVKIVNQVG